MKNFYSIVVRDHKTECEPGTIRTQDIGRPGNHLRRSCKVPGKKRPQTQSYLLPKDQYTVERRQLVPQTAAAKRLIMRVTSGGRKKLARIRGEPDSWELK